MNHEIALMTKELTIGDCLFIVSDSKLVKSKEMTWMKTMHAHPYFEIHFVIHGKLIYETPGEVSSIDKGGVCIVPPKHWHRFLPASKETSRLSIRLAFEKCTAGPKGIYEHFCSSFNKLKTVAVFNDESLALSFDSLSSMDLWSHEPVEFCEAETLLRILLLKLASKCNEINNTSVAIDASNPSDMIISSYIEHYIYYHYSGNASAKQAAEYAHISVRQLERICKRLYNKSFQDLLTEYRMSIASQVLACQTVKLKEIAEMVGFKSYDGFYKAWVKTFRSPPSQY